MEVAPDRRARRPPRLRGAPRGAAAIVTLLVLAACSSSTGSIRASSSAGARWDNFDRPDDRLDRSNGGKLPSGHEWHVGFAGGPGIDSKPADLKIIDRTLRFEGPGASYLWTTGPVPGSARVAIVFRKGSTDHAAVGLLFSKLTGDSPLGASGVAVNSVHCAFGPDSWACGVFSNGKLAIMERGSYSRPLLADGATRYSAAVSRVGVDQVRVDTPDGLTHFIRDGRIPQWWGGTVLTEFFEPAATYDTDARPIIAGYYVSGSN